MGFKAYSSESLLSSLEESWNNDYISLACSDNVMRLYSRLDESEQKDSFVIHIFHQYVPYEPILPQLNRTTSLKGEIKTNRWVFHAVLYNSGFVLDLDYTNSPTLVSVDTYFQNMWFQKKLVKDYRFQIKKASLYNKIDSNGKMNEELYPKLSFEELKAFLSMSAH